MHKLITYVILFFSSCSSFGQTIQLGTGTAETGAFEASPVNIWYRRTVCQFVYTATEIQAQGITVPSFLTQIGFDVAQSPAYNMPGYTIKLKHTNTTNVANSLGSSDWTEVISAFTYAPTSGGYDMLIFDSPFYWDGINNIAVEICWDQVVPTFNSSGRLGYYNTTDGFRYSWTDAAGSSCGTSPETVTTRKPRCQMVWTPPYNTEWTGAVNTDWFTAGNWTMGVPIQSINAVIPSGLANYPTINAVGSICKDLTIASGASLTISGANELNIFGNWTNDGNFTANSSRVHFNQFWTTTSLLNGGTQDFYSIQVNNPLGVTFTTGLYNIYGALLARGGTITTNNIVTLASNSTSTGRIPEIKSPCTWTLNMQDSWGDGWNGGYLSVFEDGTLIGTFAASGTGSIVSFNVMSGSILTMSYTAGNWEGENTYVLIDPSGTAVNSGGPNIAVGSTLYAGTSNCAISNPIVGNITAQRNLNIVSDEWRELSTPITGQTLGNWQDDGLIMAGFPGSDFPNFGWMSVYTYDETLANGVKENGWVDATDISDALNPQATHRVYIGTGNFTMQVTGTINFGDINFPLSYQNTTPSEIAAAENQKGWNLIGNPYPCTIDWDNIPLANRPNVENAIWIWSGDLGNYGLYVGGDGGIGTNGVTNQIASSQGFWVHANTTGASLTLQETDKIDTDPTFVKGFAADDFIHINLSSDQNNYKDEALLRFNSSSTSSYDSQFDYPKFYSHVPSAPSLAFVANDSIDLSLKNIPDNDEVIIPIKTLAGVPGIYYLSFSNILSDELGCVILEDKLLNTYTPITDSAEYSFFLSDTTTVSRFNLRITPSPKIDITTPTCNGLANGTVAITFYGNGPFTYEWDNVAGTSNSNTITLTQQDAGNHNLYVNSNTISCPSGNIEIIISEPTSLYANIETYNPSCGNCEDGYFVITPSGGTPPYIIYLNESPYNSDTLLGGGSYLVEIADNNNCPYSFIQNLEQITEVEDFSLNEVSIFPNPANTQITIKSSKFKKVALYDMLGSLLFETQFENSYIIPTENLPNGAYILHLGEDSFRKIVVQH